MPRNTSACLCALVLLGLPVAAYSLIGPWGSFPLNDDWQYGLAARGLAEDGRLRILPYSAMTLLGHAALGALVWKIVPGFLALRVLTLLFWVILGPATYWVTRELGRGRPSALVAALAVITCPLVVNLGTTFMTDVPFLALWTLGAAAYLRAIRLSSIPFAVLGTVLAAWAASIRQPGVFLVLACLGVLATCRVPRRGVLLGTVLASAFATLGPVAAIYFACTGGSQAFRSKILVSPVEAFGCMPGSIWAVVGTLAVLLLPALLLGCGDTVRRRSFYGLSAGMVLVALVHAKSGFLAGAAKTFPYLGNLLFNAGLGPITLVDARESRLVFASLPGTIQLGITMVAVVLGALLVTHLGRRTEPPARALSRLVILAVVLYMLPLILTTRARSPLFDRYLLPLLPLLAGMTMSRSVVVGGTRWVLAASAALLLFAVGVVGTRDYHRWNEARWDLCALAEESGGTPKTIDGGFEYSGWHNGIEAYFGNFRRAGNWRGWWVEDPVWVVGVRRRPGYEVVASRRVLLWLGLAEADLILSRRDHLTGSSDGRSPPTRR